jgi:hypothetical protein
VRWEVDCDGVRVEVTAYMVQNDGLGRRHTFCVFSAKELQPSRFSVRQILFCAEPTPVLRLHGLTYLQGLFI